MLLHALASAACSANAKLPAAQLPAGAGASPAADMVAGAGTGSMAVSNTDAMIDTAAASGRDAAAAGSAGAATQAAPPSAAGVFPVTSKTAPDPSVKFEWEETTPGSDCKPGRYVGTFSCTYSTPDDGSGTPPFMVDVSGPVLFTLSKSQNGEFLEISDGSLEGFAALIFNFTGTLIGKLDCGTSKLDATASDGVYGFGSSQLLPVGMFDGTLTGQLDRSTGVLSGQWNLAVTNAGGACIGPWTAQWMP
jgi:hypothetical protein